MKVAIWQACSRHIQRRIVPSDPHGDPRPGRVDHLHHHTTVALSDHPTTRAPNQLVARLNIEHQSIWGASYAHQMETLQTNEQITPITTIKRHRAAAGRVRHRPRSLKTAGVEVRSSSRTSTPTRNPRPPTLNTEEPGKRAKQRHESSQRSEGTDAAIGGVSTYRLFSAVLRA